MNYALFVPKQAAGANLVYFDLFNAQYSGLTLEVVSVVPIASGAVDVTTALGIDLLLTRTSAVGTGGTAATSQGVSTTACTITHRTGSAPILPEITARLTPSGGATAGAVISWTSIFTEETGAGGTYARDYDLCAGGPIIVPANSGLRVVQGAVASAGNVGFNVVFNVLAR